ncbi:MAG: hypothetical protein HOI95_06595 [Chromatiales bacterium]|nr:hypothetical protein [Chromatiales bacterium]
MLDTPHELQAFNIRYRPLDKTAPVERRMRRANLIGKCVRGAAVKSVFKSFALGRLL